MHNECHLIIYATLTNTYGGFNVSYNATSLIDTSSYFLQQKSQSGFILIWTMLEQSTPGKS